MHLLAFKIETRACNGYYSVMMVCTIRRALALLFGLLSSELISCNKIEVAIINVASFHNEVIPAFHFAWKRAGYAVTTFSNGEYELKMTSVTKKWDFEYRHLNFVNYWLPTFCRFRVVIFTSAEYKLDFPYAEGIINAGCGMEQRYILVLHNPRILNGPEFHRPLIELLRRHPSIYVMALAPHTAKLLKDGIELEKLSNEVDYLVPFFPIDTDAGFYSHSGFSIQGRTNDNRRNYHKLIHDVVQFKSLWPEGFKVMVLGNSNNKSLTKGSYGLLHLKDNLAYPKYYETIQRTYGLLTSFASDVYYLEKASSTVAASLICGVPLLTEQATIDAYSYISPTSVWLKMPTESDAEAMLRIISTPELHKETSSRILSLKRDIEFVQIFNSEIVDKVMKKLLGKKALSSLV